MESLRLKARAMVVDEVAGLRYRKDDRATDGVIRRLDGLVEPMRARGFAKAGR